MRAFGKFISALLLFLCVVIIGTVIIDTHGYNFRLSNMTSGAKDAINSAASQIDKAIDKIKDDVTSSHGGSGGLTDNPAIPVAPVTKNTDGETNQSAVTAPVAADDLNSVWGKTGMDGLTVYEYGKSLLSNKEKEAYCRIADAVRNDKDSVTIANGLSETDMEKVYSYYINDHSEVFYIGGIRMSYVKRVTGSAYTLFFDYKYSKSEIPAMRDSLRAAAVKVLAAADGLSTDYKKEKALHDRLIELCSYDIAAADNPSTHPDSFTAYGALVGHKAVCAGYAMSMKLLLSSAGIKSLYVTGTANGGSHAWNEAEIGGKWRFLDATFDDPVYTDKKGNYISYNTVSYTYFNFTAKSDHELGKFNSSNPFDRDSENYEIMP